MTGGLSAVNSVTKSRTAKMQPYSDETVASDNREAIYVEFDTLPPNATLRLNPTVEIANATQTLRACAFNLAQPLAASTNYTATVTFGEDSVKESYSWNFTTPAYGL